MNNYMLIETSSCDEARYCGAYVHGEYPTFEAAAAALHEIAEGWGKDEIVMCEPDEWKPGYCSDPEGAKYADEFWDEAETTAWRGMSGDSGFVKLEVFERSKDGKWLAVW